MFKLLEDIAHHARKIMGKIIDFVFILIRHYKRALYIVPILTAVYFTWIGIRDFIPIRVYLIIKEILQTSVTIGYFIFFPILLLLLFKSSKKYFPFLIIIPLLFGALVLDMVDRESFSDEFILKTLYLEEKHYYLIHKYSMGDWPYVNLVQCNSHDLECYRIYGTFNRNSLTLGVNDKSNEVYVFDGSRLDWISGKSPLDWDFEYITSVYNYYNHDYDLWVLYNPEQELMEFVLTGCGSASESCEVLPFRYSIMGLCGEDWFLDCDFGEDYLDWMRLEVNKENQELEVIIGDETIYSHGANPRCHVPDCVILGD